MPKRVEAVGRAVGLALAWVILASPPVAAGPPVLDQAQVQVLARIPPVVSVQITRGSLITLEHDGVARSIRLPGALALDVTANAPWQVHLRTAAPFALRVLPPDGVTSGPGGPNGSDRVSGRPGEATHRWDVVVLVPPGTPPGRYRLPVSLLVSLDAP